jgi:NAD(P)-dependent dehydrogenase (short-subunit alcohol dehydrogenase family)
MAMNQAGNFAGKVAFVTGAASGIGRAAALAFAREARASWSPTCRSKETGKRRA